MPGQAPRRVPARRGFTVSYRGGFLLSTVDPLAQAERTVEALEPLDRTLYFCPSPLLGYGLSLLLKKIGENKRDSAILCVEAEGELLDFSLNYLEPALLEDPRLAFAALDADPGSPGSIERICGLVRQKWGSRRFRRVETLRIGAGWRLHPELYGALADALGKDAATSWGNAMTLVKLGRRYARNAMRNLALLPSRFPPSLGSGPVLVLGAGPSLDGILAGLSRCFGEAAGDPASRPFRILCVDTALSCLKARGLKPDLVVALESQHWNLRDFVGMGDWEIPVAMDLSALPGTAETLGGRSFLFFTPWTEMNFFSRLEAAGLAPEIFIPLGSVGLTAVAAALRFSGGAVIAGGLDFSFTLDSYHARSSPGHREKLRRQNRLTGILNAAPAFREAAFAAVSKSGIPVRSDPAMKGYRDLFEREFSGEERLWDIQGPGLPLGLRTLSLEGALEILADGSPMEGQNFPKKEAAGASGGGGLERFVAGERENLRRLRDLLTGKSPAGAAELDSLLDYCDYLWAHFPDCAGTGGRRPPGTDISFLKRVRTEIDPFLALLNRTLAGIRGDGN